MEEFELDSATANHGYQSSEEENESDSENEEASQKTVNLGKRKRSAELAAESDGEEPDSAEQNAGEEEKQEEKVATPVTPGEPEKYRRRKLQIIIKMWKSHPKFGKRLEDIDFEGVKDMTVPELEETIRDIKFLCRMGAPGSFSKWVMSSGIKVWEKLSTTAGLQVQGLAKALEKDPEMADVMDHLMLEYADVLEISPAQQAVFLLLYKTSVMHEMNSNLQNATPPNHLPASDDILNRIQQLRA